MQKFILLRGHEGSGKSTFAAEKIAEFKQQFPDAKIVHLDNDAALTDENGVYHFDFEQFSTAHQTNKRLQHEAFAWAKAHPDWPILVINANPNQKAKPCDAMIAAAQAHGLAVEVYRLHNFYPNIHQVAEEDVWRGFLRLNQNPVENEIHVPPVQPMSDKVKQQLAQWQSEIKGFQAA